jgi:hypothetical protein
MIDGNMKGTEVRFKLVDNYESSGRPAKSSAWRGAVVMEAVADGEQQKNAVPDMAENLKVEPRTVEYWLEDWRGEEEKRLHREKVEAADERDCVPWPED